MGLFCYIYTMNRETYIKNVISFAIDETKDGGINCLDLRNKIISQFPEYELVFNRHPYHKYIGQKTSYENDPKLSEIVNKRIKDDRERLKQQFLSNFLVKPIKSTDRVFDSDLCKLLDRMKVTKICVVECIEKTNPINQSYFGDKTALTAIEYLLDILLYYKTMYIQLTDHKNNASWREERFNVVIYNMISNTRILEADLETMKFIEDFIMCTTTPELFKVVFDYPFEAYEYETLGKLNTSSYAHDALDMLFKFSELIQEDPNKFEMLKSLSGLGKTRFKTKLAYLALKCLKRPFPDLEEREKQRSVRNNEGFRTNPPYDIYDKLADYTGKSYVSYDIIDTAINVLENRCNKK